ncbi:hypothetical protein [Accumulibacter sp.]|uniref:nSTAND1 domain-containing NTPase n=1 Tax=Accumulibacter sp. TaxID=2053492 RepID=UPI0025EF2696|nr:hypothetical protein [Accumulibacter sp.]MCM8594192.1 ATP-binding protein [Accumulibacter sp.]MCM8625756.1 ATP-binding protein [Accumulibacter sp.]MDS4048335.1 hypothetical protein [Accumulibacter sp.]
MRGLREAGIAGDSPLPERPYPGLDPFTTNDAAIFFGRDADIAGVRARLQQRLGNSARGFIVVFGASGCGKSSLARAGVLPRLDHEWVIAGPITGAEGLDGLVRALGDLLGRAPSDPGQSLGASHDIYDRRQGPAWLPRDLANDVNGKQSPASTSAAGTRPARRGLRDRGGL